MTKITNILIPWKVVVNRYRISVSLLQLYYSKSVFKTEINKFYIQKVLFMIEELERKPLLCKFICRRYYWSNDTLQIKCFKQNSGSHKLRMQKQIDRTLSEIYGKKEWFLLHYFFFFNPLFSTCLFIPSKFFVFVSAKDSPLAYEGN